MELSAQILSEVAVHMKYARYIPEKLRRENWDELTTRNMEMHIKKFPHLEDEIRDAYQYVYRKEVVPSMRAMQFGGIPIELNNTRSYNCSFMPMDHTDAFSELMFLLLSGTGVGYSVQRHHVEKLPETTKPRKTRRFLVSDSIEGWSDAVKVLISSYMKGKSLPKFDFRDIRPKGARLITSGGRAPGPAPLKTCLHEIQSILDRKNDGEKLTPLEVHDINCHIADAVLSGGIRRAAMIALFNLDDEEMLTCKFGNWWELNPQRGRANNSVVLLRHRIDEKTFNELWEKIKLSRSGEPGIFFTNDKEVGTNPCAEISLKSFQFCNLCDINTQTIRDQEDYNNRARAAAFIGTLQASYTDFHYLRDVWKRTTEKDALIGVGMTGIASGTVLGLDMKEASRAVLEENKRVAKLIGIKPAARTTTVKPSGTTSTVLGTSSGIHAWHNDYYIRRIRVGKNEPIYSYLATYHPELIEDEFFKPHIQAVISVPQKAPEGAITRHESALELLDRVSTVWENWVRPGHRSGPNVNNVSTTVTIKDHEWDEVGEWMWNNRNNFTALSVLPYDDSGHTYVQLPFEDITEEVYTSMMESLKKVDLTKIIETEDGTSLQDELACAGGSCTITEL